MNGLWVGVFLVIGNIFVLLVLIVIVGVYLWLRRGYIILRLDIIIELQLEAVVSIGKVRFWEDGVLRERKVGSDLLRYSYGCI